MYIRIVLVLCVVFIVTGLCCFLYVKATEEFKQSTRPKPSQRGLMRYTVATVSKALDAVCIFLKQLCVSALLT